MGDEGGGLLLNVTGFDAPLAPAQVSKPQARVHRARSWSEKKAQKRQKQQGDSYGPRYIPSRHQVSEPTAAPAPPSTQPAAQLLKGYSLDPAPSTHEERNTEPSQQLPSNKRIVHTTINITHDVAPRGPAPTDRQQRNAISKRDKNISMASKNERIGRTRLSSRGNREATPDQDDIRAGSDEEGALDDIADVVAMAVARDAKIEAELGRQPAGDDRNTSYNNINAWHHDDNDEGGSEEEKQPYGLKDDDIIDDGVVEFGNRDDELYPPLMDKAARRKAKKERAMSGHVVVPSVRPGALTHAGANPGAAVDRKAITKKGGGDDDETKWQNEKLSFESLGISSTLSDHLSSLGFAVPTPVQQSSLPVLLQQHRDALINAPTGSGKTLSYLAPIVQDLADLEPRLQRADGTVALIISPTRELCLQVLDVLTMLTRRFIWIVPGSVHGGENRTKEKARLRRGVNVLVATPGRLLDHLQNTESFKLKTLRWLVLDEADRLLDLGFEKKIAEILKLVETRENNSGGPTQTAKRRRSVLLSATLHGSLGSLASLSLEDPVAVGFKLDTNARGQLIVSNDPASALVAHGRERFDIPAQLKQRFVEMPCKLRLVALAASLKMRIEAAPTTSKIVVFFSNCDAVEFHHAVLGTTWRTATGTPLLPENAPLVKLHGNMAQADRTQSLLTFTKASAGALLCTDVAARGLDFPSVSTIIQFDPPGAAAEYVHRVGRTARLGHAGEALLFVQPQERGYIEYLRERGVEMTEEPAALALDKALGVDARAGKPGRGIPVDKHQGAFALQRQLMDAIADAVEVRYKAETAFTSWVRAYATHSIELKPFFGIKNLHLGHVAHSFALKQRPGHKSRGNEDRGYAKKRSHGVESYGSRKRQNAVKKANTGDYGGAGGYVLS